MHKRLSSIKWELLVSTLILHKLLSMSNIVKINKLYKKDWKVYLFKYELFRLVENNIVVHLFNPRGIFQSPEWPGTRGFIRS